MQHDDTAQRAIAKREGDSARPAGACAVLVAFEEQPTRDGYQTRLEVELPVRLHDSAVDRRAFADKFLRFSPVGTAEQVAEYLRPQLNREVAAVVAGHPVRALMEGEALSSVAAALKAAAVKPLFAAGLELDGEPTVRVGAPEYQRRRVEEAAEAARTAAEEREGELLRRFEDIRRQNPDVPAGALLMGLPQVQRADALRALLKAAGSRERSRIFAVAGDALVEIDPLADEVTTLSLPGGLGPLRSVLAIRHKDRPHLLVGARDGVYLVDPDASETAEAFDADVEGTPFGFSNLGYDAQSGVIYATHADIGLATWQIDLGSRVVHHASAFKGDIPRHINVHDGQVVLAAGARLWRVSHDRAPEAVTGVEAEPIAMLVGSQREVLLVHPSGAVNSWSRSDGKLTPATARGDVIAVGAAIPWLGEARLVVGDGFSAALSQIGPHDDARLSYTSSNGPFKCLEAGVDVIAAVSADRYRMVCWLPWEERPFADLHLMSRTRSRLADVAVM